MATVKINIGQSTTPPPENTIPPIGSSNIIITAANTVSNTAMYRQDNINKPLTWWDFTTDVNPYIENLEEYDRIKIVNAGVIWEGNQIDINPSYYGSTIIGVYRDNLLVPLNTFIYKSELGADLIGTSVEVDDRKSNIPVRFIKYKIAKPNGYEHPATHTLYFANTMDTVGKFVYTMTLDETAIIQKGVGVHTITMDDLSFFNAQKLSESGINLYPADINDFLSYEEELVYQQFLGSIVENNFVTKLYFVDKYLNSNYGDTNLVIDSRLTYNNRPVVYGQSIKVSDIQLGLLKINTMDMGINESLSYNVLIEGFVTGALYK